MTMNDSIGIDVSKSTLDCYRLSDGACETFANTKSGFAKLRRWIGSAAPTRVVYEATGPYHGAFERALAGYEDVNDADRLAIDPVMRHVVGGRAVDAQADSASQMGRFETETLALSENPAALFEESCWHEDEYAQNQALGASGQLFLALRAQNRRLSAQSKPDCTEIGVAKTVNQTFLGECRPKSL